MARESQGELLTFKQDHFLTVSVSQALLIVPDFVEYTKVFLIVPAVRNEVLGPVHYTGSPSLYQVISLHHTFLIVPSLFVFHSGAFHSKCNVKGFQEFSRSECRLRA
jgi:hypothetical protein